MIKTLVATPDPEPEDNGPGGTLYVTASANDSSVTWTTSTPNFTTMASGPGWVRFSRNY